MSWAEDSKAAAAECTQVFKRHVTYSDADVAEDTLEASVGKSKVVRRYTQTGVKLITVIPVIVDNDTLTVRMDGKFTIDGQAYAVESTEPTVGDRTICNLTSSRVAEVSRGEYRS